MVCEPPIIHYCIQKINGFAKIILEDTHNAPPLDKAHNRQFYQTAPIDVCGYVPYKQLDGLKVSAALDRTLSAQET